MKIPKIFYTLTVATLFAFGCSAAQQSCPVSPGNAPAEKPESRADVTSAIGCVVSGVSGQEVSENDLRALSRQVRTDPEAQSAIGELTNAVAAPGSGVGYCPVDGKRFSSKFATCPDHHLPLQELTD